MRWNAPGSFVGTVTTLLPCPATDEVDKRSLVYSTFLAAPLLVTDGEYKEQKFSGNLELPQNTSRIGRAIDAYAHHVVADSGGEIMLADLQGAFDISHRIPSTSSFTYCNATGVIAPDGSVCLFDPQAHTYVPVLLISLSTDSV